MDRKEPESNETPVVPTGQSAKKNRGGRKPMVDELKWNLVLQALLRGHSPEKASELVGVSGRTIRRLLLEGLPKEPWGSTPMRVLIEQEREKARALRAQLPGDVLSPADDLNPLDAEEKARIEHVVGSATLEERKAAKDDALAARVAEAKMVRFVRGNVVVLAGAGIALVRPAARIANAIMANVAADLEASRKGGKGEAIDPEKGLGILNEVARYMRSIVETGHKAMEMERLLLGDPSANGRVVQDADSMTDEEMLVDLTNMAKVAASLERRGLRLVHGGRGVETPKQAVVIDPTAVAAPAPPSTGTEPSG